MHSEKPQFLQWFMRHLTKTRSSEIQVGSHASNIIKGIILHKAHVIRTTATALRSKKLEVSSLHDQLRLTSNHLPKHFVFCEFVTKKLSSF